jgi:hypothetical protein
MTPLNFVSPENPAAASEAHRCKLCGAELPAGHLLMWCTSCALEQSYTAYLERLKRAWGEIVSGRLKVRLRPAAGTPLWHLMLIGEPPHAVHAWCGEHIPTARKEREVAYGSANPNEICKACLEVAERLMEEMRAEMPKK